MKIENIILPPICIGTWALGDEYWGNQTHSDSLKTIHAAIREDFRYFDTSPVYGKGRSEQLLGQQLCNEEDIIISTKSFIKPVKSVEKSLNNSLKRLQRDYIDYFFIHWPSTKVDCRPMVELLENLKAQGKIKHLGLSNFNESELKTAQEAGNIDIVQNAFNFFWDKEKEYLKNCKNSGIKTQIYSPLAQGLLTGKFTKEQPYQRNDQRYKMSLYADENINTVYQYIPILKELAKNNSVTLHNLILKWTGSLTFVDSMIVGCRTRKQIEDLPTLKSFELNNEVLEELSKLSSEGSSKIIGGNNIFNHSY